MDEATFVRVTEQQLLLVLARDLGSSPDTSFVADVSTMPAGSEAAAAAAAELVAAGANSTAIMLGQASVAAAAAEMTAAGQEWLRATLVLGGKYPLIMLNSTQEVLR